jgi:uncharacterized membrane protein YedE/YeeE
VAEDRKERIDRELIELLNELRVVLPGVQVLFAFLLLLPFQQTFDRVTSFERGVYLLAFLAATASSILLIAPSTYHRIRFRDGDKKRMLETSGRLLLAGTVCLAVSIAAVMFLVVEFLFGGLVGAVVAGIAAVLLAGFWYGIPLTRKLRDARSGPHEDP